MTRVLFHVQHLLGIGHHRRAERLAQALVAAGATVTVAAGGEAVPGEDWGGAHVVRLPAARADGVDFKTLLDATGTPITEAWKQARTATLLGLAQQVQPDVLLLEGFPFARRQLRFELLPLLEQLANRTPRPKVIVSLRDILVAKSDPKRVREVVNLVQQRVDRVLVHGDPRLVRLDASFPAATEIADRVVYTGYVAPPAPSLIPVERRGVLVSAGGGAVGSPLFAAALDACAAGAAADQPWRIVCGPQLPEADRRQVHQRAAALGVAVDDHRTDLPQLMAAAALSISQAGYNTVLDLVAAGPRAILVPFATGGETEQPLRAALLQAGGRAWVVHEATVSGASLGAAITSALSQPLPLPLTLTLDGAATSARLILAEASQ